VYFLAGYGEDAALKSLHNLPKFVILKPLEEFEFEINFWFIRLKRTLLYELPLF